MEKSYWEQRWQAGETGWDIGDVSSALKSYIDALEDRSLRILIPGCGNAYEAAYLWQRGFEHVHVIDIVEAPLAAFAKRHPDFPNAQLIHGDFFALDTSFDLILEQTFFCALHPSMRERYVQHMAHLLGAQGTLAGVLFRTHFTKDGPPFGGTLEEYLPLFSTHLEVLHMEPCTTSIPQRAGNEVFFEARKRRS